MSKTPEEMAEEFAAINGRYDPLNANCSWGKNAFIGGYKAAQKHAHAALEEAEAKIQELRDQLMEESGCRLRLFKDNADAKAAYLEALQDTDSCEHILDMEKMVDVHGWISVKDRLPEPDTCVLIRQDDTIWVSGFCDALKMWGQYENGETCAPTHWMPLPKPPKEEE
jgi:hypothetical protein